MSGKGYRIVWKRGGFKKLRHAYGGLVEARARDAAQNLPDGYDVVVQRDGSKQRPRAYIVAGSMAARRDDAEHNTLLKVIAQLRGR